MTPLYKMFGFLLFNSRNEIVHLNVDAKFGEKLILKQLEFVNESTSGVSETATSGHSKMIISMRRSPNCFFDYNTLTQYFLPLVVLYRTKEEWDGDPYVNLEWTGLCLRFCPMPDRFLLLLVCSLNGSHELDMLATTIRTAFYLYFGPLLPLIDSVQPPMRTFKRKISKVLDDILTSSFTPTLCDLDFQWATGSIDICAFSDQCQGKLSQDLAVIGNEMQVFFGSSQCLLIRNKRLIAAVSTAHDRNGPICSQISTEDLLLLIRSAENTHKLEKNAPIKAKCQQIWLLNSELKLRILWDVFEVQIHDFQLLCLGESDCAPIISKLATFLTSLNQMKIPAKKLQTILEKSDETVKEICTYLTDMIPEENESNSTTFFLKNITRTAQLVENLWYQLRNSFKLRDKRKKNDRMTNCEEIPADYEAKIDNLSTYLRKLIQQLTSKSNERSHSYKLTLFEKCLTRLYRQDKFSIYDQSFSSLSPFHFSLDVYAYLFICQTKNICFFYVPAEKKVIFDRFLISCPPHNTSTNQQSYRIGVFSPSNDSVFAILLINEISRPNSTIFRSFWRLITDKNEANPRDSNRIVDSIWCLVLFDQATHRKLALNQAEKLVVELHDRMMRF